MSLRASVRVLNCFFWLSFYLIVCPPVSLYVFINVCVCFYLFVYSFICPSVCMQIFVFVSFFILSVCMFAFRFFVWSFGVRPYVCLSLRPIKCLYFLLRRNERQTYKLITNNLTQKYTFRRTDRQTDIQTDRNIHINLWIHTNGRADRRSNRRTNSCCCVVVLRPR